MSEKEKCMEGSIFNCIDKELTELINKARILTGKYNSSNTTEKKENLLNELLGKIDRKSVV